MCEACAVQRAAELRDITIRRGVALAEILFRSGSSEANTDVTSVGAYRMVSDLDPDERVRQLLASICLEHTLQRVRWLRTARSGSKHVSK
jgi:hypothetical protein